MLDLKIINGLSVTNEPLEVGIKNGKIIEINKILESDAKRTLDIKGQFISAGWIDSHVHCYEKMNLYYDYPDEIGVKTGVTSVIDAGSSGESNIKEFYELAKKAKTNIYALMNISKFGIVEQDELADLEKIDETKNIARINELSDFIIGIKARMSKTVVGENNITPLDLAKKLQSKFEHLPLMVHIGSAPPTLEDILMRLDKGDIVTHCYNGKPNGILNSSGNVEEYVWEAYEKGIIFDIGHGTDSFNFNVAKEAVKEGLLCQTISTDIYHRNRESGPVYDLATTLDKMINVGFTLENVIEMVTKKPAEIFGLKTKGQLKEGFDADLTIFTIEKEDKMLIDSNQNELLISESIKPTYCLVSGKEYEVGGNHERLS